MRSGDCSTFSVAIKSYFRRRGIVFFKGKPLHWRQEAGRGETYLTYDVRFTLNAFIVSFYYLENYDCMSTETSGEKTEITQKDQERPQKKKSASGWILRTVLLTFCISVSLSFVSEGLSENINLFVALVMLLFFVFLGILFDVIGVAVTTADPKNFNSMAARKIKGAKAALWCVFKAPVVSNFCNDVIGDVSGVISGSMGVVIAESVSSALSLPRLPIMVITTGVISSLTVGGKALGKQLAIKNSNSIVFFVAKVLSIFVPERVFGKK